MLQKLAEPIIYDIIDCLLIFFGDNNNNIRTFAKKSLDDTMKNLSSFSIKKIIPILIKGTEDKNWRAKLNSILGLAAVAYCGTK